MDLDARPALNVQFHSGRRHDDSAFDKRFFPALDCRFRRVLHLRRSRVFLHARSSALQRHGGSVLELHGTSSASALDLHADSPFCSGLL